MFHYIKMYYYVYFRLVYTISVVCFIYAPLMFLLRKPPGRAEDQVRIKFTKKSIIYRNSMFILLV